MIDYKRFKTFKSYYSELRDTHIENRLSIKEDEFPFSNLVSKLKEIVRAPGLILQAIDNFSTSLEGSISEKMVRGLIASGYATAIYYMFVYMLSFVLFVARCFKFYYDEGRIVFFLCSLVIFGGSICIIVDQIIRLSCKRLRREKTKKNLYIKKFSDEYDNKVADENMLEIFLYFNNSAIYHSALGTAYEKNGNNKLKNLDLYDIEKYIK